MSDNELVIISNAITSLIGYGAIRTQLLIIRKLLEVHKAKHVQHEERLDVLESQKAA